LNFGLGIADLDGTSSAEGGLDFIIFVRKVMNKKIPEIL